VVALSEALQVLGHSNAGIAGWIPARGIVVCPRFSVLCSPAQVEALRWADPPFKESCPNVYKGFIVSGVTSESNRPQGVIRDTGKKWSTETDTVI
jgi:hypothetical protein